MKRHFESYCRRCLLLVVFAATIAISTSVRADDWHFVRRDTAGSGVAEGPISKKLDVLWTYQAGGDAGFEATAIVDNDIIYIGDNYGTFHSVLLDDGRGIWKQQFPDTAFLAGAAWDEGTLYVGDANGMVSALSIEDGHEIWHTEIEGEVYAGPTTRGDDVLVTCEAGSLTCFHKATGEKRWDFKIEAPLRCTPTIAAGQILLAGCDSQLHLIDAATGKETNKIAIDAPTGATAAFHMDRVYFGTEGGSFYAIELPPGGAAPKVLWTVRDPERGQPIRSAAAVTDKLVVYGAQGKAIYARNPATGDVEWKVPTRSRVDSSPVIAGNQVVVATERGVLYVLDAATGAINWQFDAGGSFTASPVVVEGKIIIGNGDGTLYCFGPAKQKEELATEGTEVTEKDKSDN
ncbi:MAG: PQQ-binding-like beta-propeller repeat protein [Pirellulales bacterium]